MVRATEKIIAKTKKIAAHLMEAADADIELKNGAFSVAGTDKSVAWGDVCLAAYVPHNYPLEDIEPGLEETAFYDPSNFTYPSEYLPYRRERSPPCLRQHQSFRQ